MIRFAKSFSLALGLTLALVAAMLCASLPAEAKPSAYQPIERRNIVIIGDRVVDIAYNLGVLPAGMSTRCSLWPLCDKIKLMSQPLRCPGCLSQGKRGTLAAFVKANQVKLALVEKSQPFCILMPKANPMDVVEFLQKRGVEVKIVDFSQGVGPAITQTAAILGRPEEGKVLAAKYQKAMHKLAQTMAGHKLGKRVVILHGVYQASTGKSFVQVEAPGGYCDRFILGPMGCSNVGQALVPAGKKPTKGRWTIRGLKKLAQAKPDAVVIIGNSTAVQKALAKAMASQPELCRVPVFSLPGYIDSSVIELPAIAGKWFWALK